MTQKPGRFERFWQELKRREVFGVVTTYAATAYIIIEVTNNLIVPLHLPDWVTTLVLIMLVIGLPVVIILAWIFDYTSKGIERTESIEKSGNKDIVAKPAKSKLRASYVLNAILIIAVVILAYPKIFKRNKLEKLRSSGLISVAVMPFQNMSNDTIWDVWQAGIQTNIITSLSNNPDELKVRQTESISSLLQSKGLTNYASITPSVAGAISKKLDANIFINGSINQSGSIVRLNAHLFDLSTKDAIKSFQIDGTAENILNLIDTLSTMVKDFLLISILKKELPADYTKGSTTNAPEAFRYFLYGNIAFFKKMDYPSATKFYTQALVIDSNFLSAITMLATTYYNQGQFDQAKIWCLKGYNKRDQLPIVRNIHLSWLYAMLFETPKEEIKCLNQILEIDDQSPAVYYELGRIYVALEQYDKAISVMIKALEIYKKWGSKPRWVQDYIMLGYAYQETYRYRKESKLFKKAAKDFPDDPELIYRQAVLALSMVNTKDADRLIDKFVSSSKGNLASEADIAWSLGDIYWDADILEKAEIKFRESLSLEPGNLRRLNYFAYFLIDNDRNIDEGLRLINTALQQNPDNYYFLHTKGWGLYKLGKYQEALDVLQRSWDLRREKAVYDHDAFLHLEAAKKAVANQKNN